MLNLNNILNSILINTVSLLLGTFSPKSSNDSLKVAAHRGAVEQDEGCLWCKLCVCCLSQASG